IRISAGALRVMENAAIPPVRQAENRLDRFVRFQCVDQLCKGPLAFSTNHVIHYSGMKYDIGMQRREVSAPNHANVRAFTLDFLSKPYRFRQLRTRHDADSDIPDAPIANSRQQPFTNVSIDVAVDEFIGMTSLENCRKRQDRQRNAMLPARAPGIDQGNHERTT